MISMDNSSYGGLEVELGRGVPPSPLGSADGFGDDFGGWDDATYSGGAVDSFQIIRMSAAQKKNINGSRKEFAVGGDSVSRTSDSVHRARRGHGRGKRRRRRGRRRPKSAHPGGRRSRSNSRDF